VQDFFIVLVTYLFFCSVDKYCSRPGIPTA